MEFYFYFENSYIKYYLPNIIPENIVVVRIVNIDRDISKVV